MSYGAGGPRAQAIDGKCTSAKNVGRNTEIKLCIRTSMERGRWPRGVAVSARPSAAYRLPQSRQWFTTFTPSCVHSCCSTGTSNMLPWATSLAHCIPMVCACRSSTPNSSRKSLVSCHARARSCCPRGCPIAERIAHGGMVEAIGPEAIWNEYRREADTSGSDCHGRPNPAGGGLWLKGVQVMVVRSERYIMLPATPRRGRAGPSRCSFRAYRRHSSL